MIRVFTSPTQSLGSYGEHVAVSYLESHGFRVMERNVANTYGEIDIVTKRRNTYYFFEVKTGRMGSFIHPAENLTKEKLRKFLISVEYYVLVHKIRDYRVQGIVVLLGKDREMVELLDIS